MHAFILAGGFATRLWPLTEKRPKPLLPIAGKPLLTHLIEKLPKDLPVTVSTNAAFADAFHDWLTSLPGHQIDLIIEGTRADDHKLGALGAISAWVTEKHIDDDLLILTGDNYLGFSMENFLSHFKGHPLLAAHDIGDLSKASAFGTVIVNAPNPTPNPNPNPNSLQVLSFEEKPKDPKTTLVSTGCVVLPKSTLPILTEYAKHHPDNVGGIFEELLRQKLKVDCFTFTEPWMDIGSFASYLEAHKLLVGEEALIGAGSSLNGSQTTGSVVVGTNSTIISSELTDCMIFDTCHIENSTIRNCVIDSNCVLKGVDLQNQMLRAGTRLEVE